MSTGKQYKKRVLVSFRGRCPFNCKHCYTYELPERTEKTIPEITAEAGSEYPFDIIYLSQKYENFFDGSRGMALCRELYSRYQKDIFIITRSHLNYEIMVQLGFLNQVMQQQGNQLYLAVSLCADQSYTSIEDSSICPTPNQRLENLRCGKPFGIKTILMLRPIFPNFLVPTDEYIHILQRAEKYTDAVVSSGLIVTDAILTRLGLKAESCIYLENGDSEYLSDLNDARYLDVENELYYIQSYCQNRKLPFFRHSMPALNCLAISG